MKFFRKCVSVMIPDLIKCLLFYIDHTKLLVIPWNVCLSEGMFPSIQLRLNTPSPLTHIHSYGLECRC